MAYNGVVKTNAYDGRYFEFSWRNTNRDWNTRKSTIAWTLTARGTGNYSKYAASPFEVKIDNEVVYYYSAEEMRIWTENGTQIAAGEYEVTHNLDGTRSFSVSVRAGVYYKNQYNCTGSGNFELDRLGRPVTITYAANFADEGNITPTLKYTNYWGNVVDRLEAYIVGDDYTTQLTDKLSIPITGTETRIPLYTADINRLRSYLGTTRNSMTVYFYIASYVGDDDYISLPYAATFTLVNSAPTIQVQIYDINPTSIAVTKDKYTLVKGVSTAEVSITAEAKKGATITSITTKSGGKTYSGNKFTVSNIENGDFETVVTDSRGNITKHTANIELIEYFKPTVEQKLTMELVSDTTAQVSLRIDGTFYNGILSSGSLNDIVVSFRYKVNNEDWREWLTVSSLIWETYKNGNSFNVDGNIVGFNYADTVVFQSKVEDALNTATTIEYTIALNPVFEWGKNEFVVNVPMTVEGEQLNDFVIDSGTEAMGSNGTWYWRKWKSGRADCYGVRNYGNMAVGTAWGGLFRSSNFEQAFPSGLFIATPDVINISLRQGSYGGWVARHEAVAPGAGQSGSFIVVRPASANISQAYISFDIIGRWK